MDTQDVKEENTEIREKIQEEAEAQETEKKDTDVQEAETPVTEKQEPEPQETEKPETDGPDPEKQETDSLDPGKKDADKKSADNVETVVSAAKKKGPGKLLLMIIPVILLLIAGGFLIYHNSPEQRIKRQIALGDRYLGELDYEQAVAAYKMALEIDPDRSDVSEMVGNAYVQWGNAVLDKQDYSNAFGLYESAREYGKTEEADYGQVSCTIIESEDLFAQGKKEEAILVLVEIRALHADPRLPEKIKGHYLKWADELRDAGAYEKEIDVLFELLNDQVANDSLDRILEAFYRHIDTLLPGEDDDPDVRQKAYSTIIGLWNKWAELLRKLGVDSADALADLCKKEVDKYDVLYQRCFQEKKLNKFKKEDAADADEYAVIMETIRARYGAELYSINMVKDSKREKENMKPGLKEVFVQCSANRTVAAYDDKAGAYTTIAKAYTYDLYLADLNAKTIKCFKHGEYFRGGGGSERDVDGELIHYTYSGSNAAAEDQEKAKQEYIKWFASKTKGQINEKDVCIYCYGEDRIEGWNGIVKEWRMAFIASDDKYYEVYFHTNGDKRSMTCEEAGGKLISKKEKWEE